MFQRSLSALCGGLILMLASGCAPQQVPDTRAADEAAIREADAAWSKAAEANDVEQAVSYYSDDATLLPPNAPAATGKQAIRAIWAELLAPGVHVSWQVSKVEVAKSGEVGYVVGVYEVKFNDPQGKPATERGKLLEVWKKQPDGKWKAVADMFNSDAPAPPPPTQKK